MSEKDWMGNSNSIYKTLGASNHTDKERENDDYYATEPKATELLLSLEKFSPNIKLFEKYPPKTIYVSSSRLLCAKNALFEEMIAGGGSAVAYAWYIWEKGYNGETIIKWCN